MTRFNDLISVREATIDAKFDAVRIVAYREGVCRITDYIESIHAYPKLLAELQWAIDEGII